MSDTEEVAEFYNKLEEINSLNPWDTLLTLHTPLPVDTDWKNKLSLERVILGLRISQGKLVTNVTMLDHTGKVTGLKFKTEDLDYIKTRLAKCKNLNLKAKYSHLLWQELKHHDYGKIAWENYRSLLSQQNKSYYRDASFIAGSFLNISFSLNYNNKESVELVITHLSNMPVYARNNVISEISEHKKFPKSKLKGVIQSIPAWVSSEIPEYFVTKNLLTTGITIAEKYGFPCKELYRLMATNEEIILQEHPDESDFLRLHTVGLIGTYLKKAGEEELAARKLAEYQNLKSSFNLNSVSVEASPESTKLFNEYLRYMCENILTHTPEHILGFFAVNDDILVDYNQLLEENNKNVNTSITDLANVVAFDLNTNFMAMDKERKKGRDIINSYTITHGLKCEYLFIKAFTQGILMGKFNYYSIYNYLQEYTWYGQKIKRNIGLKEVDQNTSWITMLAPGIHNMIAQFELSILMADNNINNFILAIDSLTIKFEGALRDFIRFTGGTTITIKEDNPQEQLLEQLLENSKAKEFFSQNDLELFNFVFTKKGQNIRNNVAHCFLEYSDYNHRKAFLIFFCILRLGKYKFELKTAKE